MAVVRRTISLPPDLDAQVRSLAEARDESYTRPGEMDRTPSPPTAQDPRDRA